MRHHSEAAVPTRRRITVLAVASAGLAALLVLLGILLVEGAGARPSDVPGPPPVTSDGAGRTASGSSPVEPDATASPPAARVPAREVPVTRATLPPVAPTSAPAGIRYGELGIDMSVVPVGVDDDGTVGIPDTGRVAGWYRYGAAPGGGTGTVLVTSHVDTYADGLGEFARLVDAREGQRVSVTSTDGTTRNYTVTTVERIAKTDLPLDEVFDRGGPERLVLVTCGGRWSSGAGHYEDNVVVTALPA